MNALLAILLIWDIYWFFFRDCYFAMKNKTYCRITIASVLLTLSWFVAALFIIFYRILMID